MKIRITADFDYDWHRWILTREHESATLQVDENFVVVEVDGEAGEKWLACQEQWEAVQNKASELYTAYAPKTVGAWDRRITKWGDDR